MSIMKPSEMNGEKNSHTSFLPGQKDSLFFFLSPERSFCHRKDITFNYKFCFAHIL